MSTTRSAARGWFWMWIGLAFVTGIAVGIVLGVGTIVVLQTRIDYVPTQ